MPEATLVRNPFLLMLQPEVVLAAVEKSERLAQLNRRQCRPLDRVVPAGGPSTGAALDDTGGEDDAEYPAIS